MSKKSKKQVYIAWSSSLEGLFLPRERSCRVPATSDNLGRITSCFRALHPEFWLNFLKHQPQSSSISHDSSFSVHSGKSTADKTFFWPWRPCTSSNNTRTKVWLFTSRVISKRCVCIPVRMLHDIADFSQLFLWKDYVWVVSKCMVAI